LLGKTLCAEGGIDADLSISDDSSDD
jgi:hypothetical protein